MCEDLKPLSTVISSVNEDTESRSLFVQISSLGRSWILKRSYDNFRFLDRQLHKCCYDRKYSQLPELPQEHSLATSNKEVSNVLWMCILSNNYYAW